MPRLPPLSSAERSSLELEPAPRYTMELHCVETGEEFALGCPATLREARSLLAATGWLSEVPEGEPAALAFSVRTPVRRPYYTTPGHNPAFLLLSLALPFWWTEPMGLHFVAHSNASGREVTIDFVREGTMIMWSLAPLINLLPGRGYPFGDDPEPQRLELALLPLPRP